MTPQQIIRAAIPDADDAMCEHILWDRTPFPIGEVSARSLYRAASRVRRASENGWELCDLCDAAVWVRGVCVRCQAALDAARGSA